jgi:ABC-type multidrug transport system ATPase subunit
MILDLVLSDSGEVYLNGKNTKEFGVEVRQGIGYMPERTQFYRNLTALQTMEFFAELKGTDNAECGELLHKMGLAKWQDKKVGTFSKGMVQLMGIAQSLLGSPKLLILDEPTSGLDPRWSRILKDTMLEVNSSGTTVFFSSHLLSEVQELCNRVAILNQGKLIIEDTMKKVSEGQEQKPKLVMRISNEMQKAAQILKQGGFPNLDVHGNVLSVHCDSQERTKVLNLLAEAKIAVDDFRTEELSLEDAFMKYIGEERTVGGELNEA